MSLSLDLRASSISAISTRAIFRISFVIVFGFFINDLCAQFIDPAELPDVETYAVVQSNPNADTVIIALHGGPSDELYNGSFFYFEEIETFSVVEMLKYEMIHDVMSNESLTIEEGYAVNDTTVAMIEKLVQHYNAQDKEVVVLGHSWGALVMGEYLDDYGVESVYKFIPMEGRLSVPQEFVDILLTGYLPTFDSDGMTIVVNGSPSDYPQGLLTLGAAAFANNWVDSLQGEDLSKMMYTYSEFDMNTGALREEETTFLNQSGAQTLFVPGGYHGSVFESFYLDLVVEFIREDNVSDVVEIQSEDTGLSIFPTVADNWITVSAEKSGVLTFFDMNGRKVLQRKVTEMDNINISDVQPGQYMVIHEDGQGGYSTARLQVMR